MVKLLIIITLIASQIFPTFGGVLGSSGNGIPLFICIGGFGSVVLIYLFEGIPSRFFTFATFLLCIGIAYAALVTVLSPFYTSIRDLSIVIKAIAMYCAVIAGFMFYRSHPDALGTITKCLIFVFVFHLALYIDHLRNPNSFLQTLYHFKTNPVDSGGRGYYANRFPGTWNFPYPEAIFMTFCFMLFTLLAIGTKKALGRFFFILMAVSALYVGIFGTQSRANLVALGVTILYLIIVYSVYSLSKNKAIMFVCSLGILGFFGIVAVSLLNYLVLPGTEAEFRHLASIDEVAGNLSNYSRVESIENLFLSLLSEEPWRFLIGFGGARNVTLFSDLYVESIFNYIFNYGLIGFVLITSIWFYIGYKTLFHCFAQKQSWQALNYLFAHGFIFYVFVMGISGDMFTHFRFIPLFYFFAGVFFAVLQRYRKAHMNRTVYRQDLEELRYKTEHA